MTRFNRFGLAAAAAVVSSTVLAAGADRPPLPSGAQRETRQQHAIVSVLDSNDAPITNLSAGDFVVREDGIAREVLRVTAAAPPSHLVLLIDDSQATDGLTVDLRAGLKSFVGILMDGTPSPAVRLATFGDRPTTRVEFSTSVETLHAGIERIFARPGAGATFLEAIVETCRDLRTRKAERPVIVAFVAEAGPEFSEHTDRRIADVLRDAGAALWTVTLESRAGPGTSDSNRQRSMVIGDVVRRSGGWNKPILTRQSLDPAFQAVAKAIASRYDVTYGRLESLIPPTKLEVSVRQGSPRVLAPAWVLP